MPPVDERALHRHQVHPVEDRVHHEGVVQAVGGDGAGVVLLGADLERRPPLPAVALVEGGRGLEASLGVGLVLRYLRPRAWQQREEPHPSQPLGVAGEERVEGLVAADDVLRQLEPVHAQQELRVAPPRAELLAEGLHLRGRRHPAKRPRVERDRIGPHQDAASLDLDPPAPHVHLDVVERLADAQQEVLRPAVGLEAQDVGAEHPAQELLAHRVGQEPEVRRSGERRVREVGDPDLRGHLAQEPRDHRQLVVLDRGRRDRGPPHPRAAGRRPGSPRGNRPRAAGSRRPTPAGRPGRTGSGAAARGRGWRSRCSSRRSDAGPRPRTRPPRQAQPRASCRSPRPRGRRRSSARRATSRRTRTARRRAP